jgi:hypothetical protein
MSNEIFARFMGWELQIYKDVNEGAIYYVPLDNPDEHVCFCDEWKPTEDWNDWKLVEARLREEGLWEDYCFEIWEIVDGRNFPPPGRAAEKVMAASLEQRVQAALEVIDDPS